VHEALLCSGRNEATVTNYGTTAGMCSAESVQGGLQLQVGRRSWLHSQHYPVLANSASALSQAVLGASAHTSPAQSPMTAVHLPPCVQSCRAAVHVFTAATETPCSTQEAHLGCATSLRGPSQHHHRIAHQCTEIQHDTVSCATGWQRP
jgi:hypothetical protein